MLPTGRIYVRSTRPMPQVALHRFLMGSPKGMDVDHKNNDTLDNRRLNLRIATRGQNNANSRWVNQSGYRGVSRHRNRWVAQIGKAGRRIYLGLFGTAEEAAKAYDAAAKIAHAEFATLNFPDD